ncbi:MAG: hypothetical protein HY823_11545 [Acidobacteria bacterium]|nr:hypothetical protein [Acidobacteriota bacterium]
MRIPTPAVLLLFPALLAGEEPKVRVWVGVKQERNFQVNWREADPAPALRVPLKLGDRRERAEATVVVWGDSESARQEEMQRFVADFSPLFRSAFDGGRSATIGGQMLAQLMALAMNPNQNPAPSLAPAVWYSALDPWAKDPKFRRR